MGTNQFIEIGGKKVFNGIDGVYKRKSNDDLVFLKHSSTEEWIDLEGNEFSFKRYDLTIKDPLKKDIIPFEFVTYQDVLVKYDDDIEYLMTIEAFKLAKGIADFVHEVEQRILQ